MPPKDRIKSIQVGFVKYKVGDDVLYYDAFENKIVSSSIHHFKDKDYFYCPKDDRYHRTQFLTANLDSEVYVLE